MPIDPKKHDEEIAALYHDLAKAQQHRAHTVIDVMASAGYEQHYFGSRASSRAWGVQVTSDGDHWEWIRRSLNDAMANFSSVNLDVRVKHASKTPRESLVAYDLAEHDIHAIKTVINHLEKQYTGWSRFFLVTSSAGHIHSSMLCSTCRDTTTYGWLPELSGKDEAQAVEAHGPALCSVCFPSAPVDWQDEKISKAKAETMAWSPDRDEKIAAKEAEAERKAAAKVAKAARKLKSDESLAHKINTLIDLGLSDKAAYEWTWTHKGFDNAYYVYKDLRTTHLRRNA